MKKFLLKLMPAGFGVILIYTILLFPAGISIQSEWKEYELWKAFLELTEFHGPIGISTDFSHAYRLTGERAGERLNIKIQSLPQDFPVKKEDFPYYKLWEVLFYFLLALYLLMPGKPSEYQ